MIYILLFILLGIQIWVVFQAKKLPKLRFRVKLILNLLLWIALFLLVYQPEWKSATNTNKVLIISENVPKSVVEKIHDSLDITRSFTFNEFIQKDKDNDNFTDKLGNVFLLGEGFNSLILSKLQNKNIRWIPYFQKDELQKISWQGVLQKNQKQEITGAINLSNEDVIKLKYGNQILDSLSLKKGFNRFNLSFRAFAIGKTEVELFIGEKPLKKIAFFTRQNQTLAVKFILQNPDFEAKNLADWLGKNGHRVEIQTLIAKNAQSQGSINKSDKKFEPDLIITDASNAGNQQVKKAIGEGKSVLFIGLVNPDTEIKQINQALGTRWNLKKISNQENVKITEDLTALPFQFIPNIAQKTLVEYPISIHKTTFKVGVSLLNETFPLKLSGDSLAYAKIWNSVFEQLLPPATDNLVIQSPIFKDTKTEVLLNNLSEKSPNLRIENDTIQMQQSVVNPLTYTANYTFRKEGWQPLADSLEVFVEPNDNHWANAKQIENLIELKSVDNNLVAASNQEIITKIPDWIWFLLIIACLSMLWVEPKLRF